ncbi:MAG: helix-turn-helix transcriptional regulator [Quadrisphaera sp.]
MPERGLSEAMIATVRERMVEQRLSGRALAERIGMDATTLAAHLRGEGKVELEEWDALAVTLGASGLEELLAEARRRE